MAFFLNPAQREGTALLEDSFCAGRCGQQRHNTGHICAAVAAAAAIRAAVDACPALSSDLSGGGDDDDADAVAAWACAGGRRAERAYRCRGVDPEACSALDGPARRRPGAPARRLVGASALLRVDAPAPGASAVCAPLPEWQGRLGARK